MKAVILRECLRIAERNRFTGHQTWYDKCKRHFSFIIQRNKIIGWGVNSFPIDKRIATVHAEVDAFRRTRGILNHRESWDMINIRVKRSGKFKFAAPCSNCASYLYSVGCRNIWFSTDSQWFAKIGLNNARH